MKYYKVLENEKITMFGKQTNIPSFAIEITAEEYAKLQEEFKSRQAIIAEYVQKVTSGEMAIDEVPEDCREEVNAIVNPEPTYSEDYLSGYDQAVLDMMGVE